MKKIFSIILLTLTLGVTAHAAPLDDLADKGILVGLGHGVLVRIAPDVNGKLLWQMVHIYDSIHAPDRPALSVVDYLETLTAFQRATMANKVEEDRDSSYTMARYGSFINSLQSMDLDTRHATVEDLLGEEYVASFDAVTVALGPNFLERLKSFCADKARQERVKGALIRIETQFSAFEEESQRLRAIITY